MTNLNIPQDGRGSYGKQVRAKNKERIQEFCEKYPEKTHKQCAEELNISKVTVYAIVKEIREESNILEPIGKIINNGKQIKAINKERIIKFCKKYPEKTYKQCAEELNISDVTVYEIVKEIREELNILEPIVSNGKQIKARNKERIIKFCKKYPEKTYKECAKALKLSKTTVYATVKEIRKGWINPSR